MSNIKESKITFSEFVEDLQRELKEHKDWGDKELEFSTIDGGGLEYLSVYDTDDNTVCIDVGTEEDNDEWNKAFSETLEGGMK